MIFLLLHWLLQSSALLSHTMSFQQLKILFLFTLSPSSSNRIIPSGAGTCLTFISCPSMCSVMLMFSLIQLSRAGITFGLCLSFAHLYLILKCFVYRSHFQ